MVEVAHSIDLNLPEKLRDKDYRQRFFLAESSAQIAEQLIALRKRRDLNQQEVAELVGTQQPAISRVEKADYQSWSFNFLRKIAGALDARIRVLIEPAEDVINEYDEKPQMGEGQEQGPQNFLGAFPVCPSVYAIDLQNLNARWDAMSIVNISHHIDIGGHNILSNQPVSAAPVQMPIASQKLRLELIEKDKKIALLEAEIQRLQVMQGQANKLSVGVIGVGVVGSYLSWNQPQSGA